MHFEDSHTKIHRRVLLLALPILMEHLSLSLSLTYALPKRVRLRPGFPDDKLPISITMMKERMNPLGISHQNNMLVAEDIQTGERMGWAQIRSLGYAGVATAMGDPSQFTDGNDDLTLTSRNVQVQSTLLIEKDVDEEMWQEFEDDPVDFPNGLASLPWTEEYRAASQAATDRLRRRERILELELASRPQLWELSSVYVKPEWRHQCIGSALVNGVLEQHVTTKRRGRDVFALTLASKAPWYEQFGFREEEQIPNAMKMEMIVGRGITKMIGEDLVCMHASFDSHYVASRS